MREPGFERQRMMHEGNDWMGCTQDCGGLREDAVGQPIDDNRPAGRHPLQAHQRLADRRIVRTRKALAEVDNIDVAAEPPQFRDHAPVIGVAAGRLVETAGHRKGERYHSVASYQARAEGDSATVTRIVEMSRPSRPSPPLFTAAARPSKTCRVRNSVVVLADRNCGMS